MTQASNMVGVVVRQLRVEGSKDCEPVVSAVFRDPGDRDSLDSYFREEFETHKRQVIEKFPEFENANWYLTILRST